MLSQQSTFLAESLHASLFVFPLLPYFGHKNIIFIQCNKIIRPYNIPDKIGIIWSLWIWRNVHSKVPLASRWQYYESSSSYWVLV